MLNWESGEIILEWNLEGILGGCFGEARWVSDDRGAEEYKRLLNQQETTFGWIFGSMVNLSGIKS